jgi:hypothetical protein
LPPPSPLSKFLLFSVCIFAFSIFFLHVFLYYIFQRKWLHLNTKRMLHNICNSFPSHTIVSERDVSWVMLLAKHPKNER